MSVSLWNNGHLSWLLIIGVVWTVVALVAADYSWRRIKIRAGLMAGCAFLVWIAGILIIIFS